MLPIQSTTEISPIDSPVPSTSNAMAQMSFSQSPIPSTSNTAQIPFPRYRLARNMNRESTPRTNRPSTDSRSASSHDSRAYSRQLRTRHQRSRSPYHRSSPNRFTGEIEVKDEPENLPQDVELFMYGILKKFMDKYIKHG
ncbi:hypothetical protein TNCV_747411 [Trichonephila clavipes]|nr:hypothetical protein TNCV_747411 [Trichonephila clavipes]